MLTLIKQRSIGSPFNRQNTNATSRKSLQSIFIPAPSLRLVIPNISYGIGKARHPQVLLFWDLVSAWYWTPPPSPWPLAWLWAEGTTLQPPQYSPSLISINMLRKDAPASQESKVQYQHYHQFKLPSRNSINTQSHLFIKRWTRWTRLCFLFAYHMLDFSSKRHLYTYV